MAKIHYDQIVLYGKHKDNFFRIGQHLSHTDKNHTGITLIKPDNTKIYVLYDHTLLKDGIKYINSNPTPDNPIESIKLENREIIIHVLNGYGNSYSGNNPTLNNAIAFTIIYDDLPIEGHFPYLYDWSENHTEYAIPQPETPLEFLERITARLFQVTQRIAVLRHEEPHQNALSENICREVPEDHDEVLRYDLSNNLIKRPVGWLCLQLETFTTYYQRYLDQAEAAQKAGRPAPAAFNRRTDMNKIETMLEKIETSLTEECLRDHFDLHETEDWNRVHNTERKITLCKDDQKKSPGEVLVDVNAFFTDGRGNIAQTHAKKTYHDISTKYWVMAKRTTHRKLVTERTVTMS